MDCKSEVYAKKLIAMMKKESALTMARFVTFLKEKGHDVQELADEFALQDAKPKEVPKKPRVARAKKQDTTTDASEILKKDEFVC